MTKKEYGSAEYHHKATRPEDLIHKRQYLQKEIANNSQEQLEKFPRIMVLFTIVTSGGTRFYCFEVESLWLKLLRVRSHPFKGAELLQRKFCAVV